MNLAYGGPSIRFKAPGMPSGSHAPVHIEGALPFMEDASDEGAGRERPVVLTPFFETV